MNRKLWIGIILVVIMGIIIVTLSNKENKIEEIDTTNDVVEETSEIKWNEITEDGIDEELLLENIDINILEKIASNFQSMLEEEQKEEQENPEILITEGWIRIFEKEKYKEVISIGKPAMKPLYYILYKSQNNGLYEYLCASALQEISQVTFYNEADGTAGWSNAKEYLELFTKEIAGH